MMPRGTLLENLGVHCGLCHALTRLVLCLTLLVSEASRMDYLSVNTGTSPCVRTSNLHRPSQSQLAIRLPVGHYILCQTDSVV